jgi:hypothetical protein
MIKRAYAIGISNCVIPVCQPWLSIQNKKLAKRIFYGNKIMQNIAKGPVWRPRFPSKRLLPNTAIVHEILQNDAKGPYRGPGFLRI